MWDSSRVFLPSGIGEFNVSTVSGANDLPNGSATKSLHFYHTKTAIARNGRPSESARTSGGQAGFRMRALGRLCARQAPLNQVFTRRTLQGERSTLLPRKLE